MIMKFLNYIWDAVKSVASKFWKQVIAVLKFLGLIDGEGSLSRTNLLIYIFTFKFAFVPMADASIHEIALALAAMGVYMGKKVVGAYENKNTTQEVSIVESAEDLYENMKKDEEQ